MKFPIDDYEIKARYAPAFLVAAPILTTLWTSFNIEVKDISAAAGAPLTIIIWYSLATLVRHCGKKVEPHLWKTWGSAPSTSIVLWKDDHIGHELKTLYHRLATEKLGLPMPTEEAEIVDPENALKLIAQAFARIRGIIRKHDPEGLWSKANAEYGFVRNLYGSRWLWSTISATMTIISGYLWLKHNTDILFFGFTLNIAILALSIYLGFFVCKTNVNQTAWRYAESAWESFCNIYDKT